MKLISWAKENRYEIIALLTGASVLMLEIAGARLLSPYFGASIYVWTAMIGVILAALSVGYWYGGKAADKDNPKNDLSLIITAAAVLIAVMTIFYKPVLDIIARGNLDLRLSAVIAALVLFSIPSALIGMVSPHLAKIRIDSLETSGTRIGRLEAAGAIGSIVGTFAAGYFLLAYFGSRDLTIFISILLILTSFLADRRRFTIFRLLVLIFISALLFIDNTPKSVVFDTDSSYARYQVERSLYRGKLANLLKMDNKGIQSAYYVNEPNEPVLSYAQQTLDTINQLESIDSVLVIGGGAYTIPTQIHSSYPEAEIQIVEIDPAMDKIATDYFGFKPNDKTAIAYEDGRTFLNKNTEKYDVIIIDAFSFLTPPFQISTLEAVERIHNSLNEPGVVIVNVASRANKQILSSLYKTYMQKFNYSTIHKANESYPDNISQNYLLYTSDDPATIEKISANLGAQATIPDVGIVLTDDYAPVERLNY